MCKSAREECGAVCCHSGRSSRKSPAATLSPGNIVILLRLLAAVRFRATRAAAPCGCVVIQTNTKHKSGYASAVNIVLAATEKLHINMHILAWPELWGGEKTERLIVPSLSLSAVFRF